MQFCGELPFSSGVMPLTLERTRLVTYALLYESMEDNPFFVLAYRKQTGYEWQVFRFPSHRALITALGRHEHVLRRRREGFRFYVVSTTEDHNGVLRLGAKEPLTSFVRQYVRMKKVFLNALSLEASH